VAGIESAILETQEQIRRHRFCLRALAPGLVCLLLGMLLAVQFRTQRVIGRTPAIIQSAPIGMLSALVEANARLRQERAALASQIAEYRRTSEQERLTALVDELNRLRIANGLVETKGPGIELQIEWPLSPLEVQDLINELHNAGAEAIALNGQRIVASSVIVSDGEILTVNGHPLSPPYNFQIIGGPQDMTAALRRQGGLLTLLAQAHGEQGYRVIPREEMALPVYTRPLTFQYARPLE